MENQLVKLNPEQLEEIVKNSGLEIQEGEVIKQSYLPFLIQLSEIQEQSTKINFKNPTDIDEKIARELRLKTVKIRTGSSDLKDSRKRIHLLKGNLEQAAFNIISASCKLAEETFVQVEKAREIAEQKRKAELKAQREMEVQPYLEYVPFGIDLGQLDDENYNKLITGAKLQMQAKIDAELKAEAERIARQKEIDAENERIRLENARLQKEAEEKQKALEIERKKQADILAKQKAEADKKAKIEADRQAKIQAELKAKADAERKEKERLESELKAKQKAESEAKLKAEKIEKERIAAEKKAAKAPDKKKLNKWVESFEISLQVDGIKPESEVIYNSIIDKFNAFKNWAKTQIENI